jgi:NADPH-dependent F420 reductase
MSGSTTPTHPTIAILGGTGKEGPGLALRWASAGYKIIIGSRQLQKAQATAREINGKLVAPAVTGMENSDAARAADLCILTVVQDAHLPALESVKEAVKGKILVDATARVDFRNPTPPAPPAAARQAQDLLGPEVRVVAAFQNVPSHVLKKNLGQSLDADVLVCSDDQEAAKVVMQLAEAGGMRAYYAGNLDNALVIEGITSLLISINQYYGVKTASIGIMGISK